jgi:hypothetical protein
MRHAIPYLIAVAIPCLFVAALSSARFAVARWVGSDDSQDVRLPVAGVLAINILSLLLSYWWIIAGLLLAVGLVRAWAMNR